jgi:hypothetical protein
MRHQTEEALTRAVSGISASNYPTIIAGFLQKGIPAEEIKPRENVFTFQAWLALDRVVKLGEHGVKVLSFMPVEGEDKEGRPKTRSIPRMTTVFHISQTIERNNGYKDLESSRA